ncbi:MAG: c-type cytochrome [Gemmatimonas sp.]
MSPLKKWTLRILGGLAALLIVAVTTIYVMSERTMARTYALREVPITLPTDSASLARGAHLVELSCRGCHGPTMQGEVMFEEPGIARIVAPNVLDRLTKHSDSEFAGYMRYGVKKDGSTTFIMPPPGFYHMSDADLAAVIAYLRSQPIPAAIPLPANSFGPIGRMGIALGEFGTSVKYIDTTQMRVGADTAHLTTRRGEYMVRMICAECHGPKLTGDSAFKTPSLSVAVGYNLAQFTTLLRTGTPRDPATKLTMMAKAAQGTLKHLSDDEIAAIHGYLVALPPTGVPGVK